MTHALEVLDRRLRRLRKMEKEGAVDRANQLLTQLWEEGHKPSPVLLRTGLLTSNGKAGALSQLVRPRGVAMRFYLLALFEAQCRLTAGARWTNDRPLEGQRSWSDLIAIDGAYNSRERDYNLDTKQDRTSDSLRLRQVKSALRSLEAIGSDTALARVPTTPSDQRSYKRFELMKETGRGRFQTSDIYTVPEPHWNAKEVIRVPTGFYKNGWIQVLQPSEVLTWLTLQHLSQWAHDKHRERGVYLTGQKRITEFGVKRDAWEDSCKQLTHFGLIKRAPDFTIVFGTHASTPGNWQATNEAPENGRPQYEAHRWQVTDEGLEENPVRVLDRELNLQKRDILKTKNRTT
ncbi:hypothetical protein [Streptomyces bohaiensis]|uniref:Uncharacterized protein n=1 Tax=Streptomyces bohaiensis TaxID=1431344 RepID=A0ABX1CBS0_9ACTN|nr:hypothetical protein [Streptomyces bohaiensis]NJQ16568.1 hypothetical protein [Streptomyces bohaiensis]